MNCCRRPDSVSYCPIIARFLLTTVLLILPVTALATMILVPTGPADHQAGIDAAAAGDTVLVEAGTYTWTNQGTPAGGAMIDLMTGVSLVGVDPEAVVIDAEGQGSVIGGMTPGHRPDRQPDHHRRRCNERRRHRTGVVVVARENCRIVGNTATERAAGSPSSPVPA